MQCTLFLSRRRLLQRWALKLQSKGLHCNMKIACRARQPKFAYTVWTYCNLCHIGRLAPWHIVEVSAAWLIIDQGIDIWTIQQKMDEQHFPWNFRRNCALLWTFRRSCALWLKTSCLLFCQPWQSDCLIHSSLIWFLSVRNLPLANDEVVLQKHF